MVVAGLNLTINASIADKTRDTMHIVIFSERSELGMFFCIGNVLHLRVISRSVASGVRATEMTSLLSHLQRTGLLPADLSLDRAIGAVWYPPTGAALELETHVAKRCLLAGTAGGFADSVTGQTLGPGVVSALIAAETASAALKKTDVQGTLAEFKNSWREELAECIRPPGTSLHLLLPLLFVNSRVVSKFTRTLLAGESI